MGITKIIMKRSINLSKTFLLVSAVMAVMAIGLSSMSSLLPLISVGGLVTGLESYLPQLFVALGALTAVLMATPVILLFVYDKNNGVLEYLLSVGMTQRTLFGSYLKASLALAGILLLILVLGNAAMTLILGGDVLRLPTVSAIVLVLGLSAVAFSTVAMMAFSSLQKQRVGANQPLGLAFGVVLILPTYFLPAIFPELAFTITALNTALAALLAVAAFLLAGRLIKREKLLP